MILKENMGPVLCNIRTSHWIELITKRWSGAGVWQILLVSWQGIRRTWHLATPGGCNNYDSTPCYPFRAVNAYPKGKGCWSAMGMAFNLVNSSSSFIGNVGRGLCLRIYLGAYAKSDDLPQHQLYL